MYKRRIRIYDAQGNLISETEEVFEMPPLGEHDGEVIESRWLMDTEGVTGTLVADAIFKDYVRAALDDTADETEDA